MIPTSTGFICIEMNETEFQGRFSGLAKRNLWQGCFVMRSNGEPLEWPPHVVIDMLCG